MNGGREADSAAPAVATATAAAALNREFYESEQPGVTDYWTYMAAPRARMATVLREVRRAAPTVVVDLGCGGGQVLAEIAAALPRVRLHGIDISAPRIEANRRLHRGIDWHVADLDGERAPPAGLEGAADVVIATEIVEHLDAPESFLRGALALARRPGGRLIVTTQSGRVQETERRVGHRRHYSPADMEHLLARAGWTPERVWNSGWPFHDLSKWYANRDVDRSMATFAARAYGPRERAICWALRCLFRLNSDRRGAQLYGVARRA